MNKLILNKLKKLEKLGNKPVRFGRKIVPNAMLYAHRSATSRFVCTHQKGKAKAANSDNRMGMHRSWHKNGQVACEYSLSNGEMNGLFREWRPDGMLMSEQVYNMGEPQLIRQYGLHSGELFFEVVSDGCASRQKALDFATKKWREYFVVHGKVVSRKKYLAFIKRQKNASVT